MNIKWSSVVLALLVGVASGASFDRIIQLQNEGSHLIAAGRSNYAIISPLLANTNWETVSVNSNDLLAIGPNCSRIDLTFGDLSDEQRELIGKIMRPFEEGAASQKDPNLVVEFELERHRIGLGKNVAMDSQSFGKPGNWFRLETLSDRNMAVSLGWLGERGISKIMYVNDTVTIVYTDGRVKTEPRKCLQEKDRLLLKEISLERKEYNLRRTREKLHECLAEVQKDVPNLI